MIKIIIGNIAIIYFSATGTTKGVAEKISNVSNGDLIEILPKEPYTSDDLAYNNDCRANREQQNRNARPEISNEINIENYETVFLGYPIWWGDVPKIILTFLDNYSLDGKTVIPFCTSGSTGISQSQNTLENYNKNINWLSGRRFSSNVSEEEISNWIGGLNIETIKNAKFEVPISSDAKNFPIITLNNGDTMPVFGLGTYSLTEETCVNSVYTAIKTGYRLIDTAYMYGNEVEVGEAVRKAIDDGIITRDEIFIITKLYPNQYSDPETAIEQALQKLDIDYIDMMLLHHPGTDDVKAYQAMEKYVESGKIKSLGLSNYYIKELDEFLSNVKIKPALVQNEIHPYYQESDVVKYIQSKGIVMQGWYPLGGRGHQIELLNDKTLKEIAKNHNKTVAQVILRWNMQNGVIAIPGSSNPEHILENISIFDFKLTDDEMKQIYSLNRDEKHDWY